MCSLIRLVYIGIKLVKRKLVIRIMKILAHPGLWFWVGFVIWACTLALATSKNGVAEIQFFEDGNIEMKIAVAGTGFFVTF